MADTKYKVAVATSDGKTVDSHFGHVSNFLIFEVDEETGKFEDIEDRDVKAACSGGSCAGTQAAEEVSGCGSGAGCGGHNGAGPGDSSMDLIAKTLSDVDYVLVARIGPHAVQALAATLQFSVFLFSETFIKNRSYFNFGGKPVIFCIRSKKSKVT